MFASESKVETKNHVFENWTITATQSHIMTKNQRDYYEKELTLPHLPDMVFSHNSLRLEHKDGMNFYFNPIDALRTVNDHEDLVHVAMAEEWMKARENTSYIRKIIHPFDWTFTPIEYYGAVSSANSDEVMIETTDERIDYAKLKEREAISFFDDILLYEDELDDNGCSKLSVKIRVMPTSLFCLLRFYLRVDGTMVRIHDTRFYYQTGKNYILREHSKRESMASQLNVPAIVWHDQNEISNHLKLLEEVTHKIVFPVST